MDNLVEIVIYHKRDQSTMRIEVEQLSDNIFRTIDNGIFYCHLTLGTEFETRLNKDGNHEIVRITKKSEFITRRFFINSQFKESEYKMLGDEIVKHGGFWQVDFGSVTTVNLPKDCKLDIDEIFRIFDFEPAEII